MFLVLFDKILWNLYNDPQDMYESADLVCFVVYTAR